MDNEEGTLYIIPTPIGNMWDTTYRAIDILSKVEALACEDTRRTIRIFDHYKIHRPKTIFSCHEHNEQTALKRIWGLLRSGVDVALVSEAGVPGISDPGYRTVNHVLDNSGKVTVLPGASAVQTALISSGLPSSSYTFKGFPPRKAGRLRKFLEMERESIHTLIFFESPFRLKKFLPVAFDVLGDRRATVCIELTKMYESVHRGRLSSLAERFADQKVKGEITVVIEGFSEKQLEINKITQLNRKY